MTNASLGSAGEGGATALSAIIVRGGGRTPSAAARLPYRSASMTWVAPCCGSSSRMVLQMAMALMSRPSRAKRSATSPYRSTASATCPARRSTSASFCRIPTSLGSASRTSR